MHRPSVRPSASGTLGLVIVLHFKDISKVIRVEKRLWHQAQKVRLKAILAFVALFWGAGWTFDKGVIMSNLQ